MMVFLNSFQDFKAIVAAWNKEGILYQSPAGCNDDWFWLYAAVAMKCKVVTNDEMRDHHFQMLSPR
jgi:proteinaceous RNase P